MNKWNILIVFLIVTNVFNCTLLIHLFISEDANRTYHQHDFGSTNVDDEKISNNSSFGSAQEYLSEQTIREIISEAIRNELTLIDQRKIFDDQQDRQPIIQEDLNNTLFDKADIENSAIIDLKYRIQDAIALGEMDHSTYNDLLVDVSKLSKDDRRRVLTELVKAINRQKIKLH